jgi:hypothetical protein
LLKLEVAVWIDKLILFVVEKNKGDNGPEDLKISFKLDEKLER